jgi:hypothetical protein
MLPWVIAAILVVFIYEDLKAKLMAPAQTPTTPAEPLGGSVAGTSPATGAAGTTTPTSTSTGTTAPPANTSGTVTLTTGVNEGTGPTGGIVSSGQSGLESLFPPIPIFTSQTTPATPASGGSGSLDENNPGSGSGSLDMIPQAPVTPVVSPVAPPQSTPAPVVTDNSGSYDDENSPSSGSLDEAYFQAGGGSGNDVGTGLADGGSNGGITWMDEQ